jgi:hypothetical protein
VPGRRFAGLASPDQQHLSERHLRFHGCALWRIWVALPIHCNCWLLVEGLMGVTNTAGRFLSQPSRPRLCIRLSLSIFSAVCRLQAAKRLFFVS